MAARSRYQATIKIAPNRMPTNQRKGPDAPFGTVSDAITAGNRRGVSKMYASASKPAPSMTRDIFVAIAGLSVCVSPSVVVVLSG